MSGAWIGFFVGGIACFVISFVRGFITHENSFEVWFVFFAIEATMFFVKYAKLRKTHELITAITYVVLCLTFLVLFILQLMGYFHG